MEYSEQKLATFTEGKTRIQLLKMTNEYSKKEAIRLINTVGGFKLQYSDGSSEKIEDKDKETIALFHNLKKNNENYYYKEGYQEYIKSKEKSNTKYQIRINRKRVYTTGFEYDARKYFATEVQNTILQLKIC